MRAWAESLKEQVVAGYGGKCYCCGIDRPEFLTIDHIHGGGNMERKRTGLIGYILYYHLIQNGFPKDRYRLSCYNCNAGRGCKNDLCPHQRHVCTA